MKRKPKFTLLAAFLSIVMFVCMLPTFDAYAETTQEKLEKAQQEQQQTKDKINSTKDKISNTKEKISTTQNSIAGYTDKKESLQGKLEELNEQLTQVSENLARLEGQIQNKEEEIEQTKLDLEEAKQAEEDQYEAMKKRVQFMYEKKNFMISEVLFGGGDISEMLNVNEYFESLVSYDKRMMDEYAETRKTVENTEARLVVERNELEEYHKEVLEEQKQVQGYVDSTTESIKSYSGKINNAKAQAAAYEKEAAAYEKEAAAYEAQMAEQNRNIADLKKQLEEELALSKLAAQSSWRNISDIQFTEDDRYLLANLIYCEAGNQPYEGQVAVGAVVINRVLSEVFPNTVVGVIYQNKQFSPVASGRLALALAENRATEACYKAADAAMAGQTTVGSCLFFRTPIEGLSGIQIGGHIFY